MKIMEILLNKGVNINFCMGNGISFFYIVLKNGDDIIVWYLIYKGVNINLCIKIGVSFFYVVC